MRLLFRRLSIPGFAALALAGCGGGGEAEKSGDVMFRKEPEIRTEVQGRQPRRGQPVPRGLAAGVPFTVRKALPGARLELENGRTVRLRGILPPPEGTRAAESLDRWLAKWCEGQTIVLEMDEERLDESGAGVAWASLQVLAAEPDAKSSGLPRPVDLSAAAAGMGLVRAWPSPPDLRRTEAVEFAQREAREAGLGIWARGAPPLPATAFAAGATRYHLSGCPLARGAAERAFESPQAAEQAGFLPCPACRPRECLRVPGGIRPGANATE